MTPNEIVRLAGVYDANGTTRGEVSYWLGARLGLAHCALCDITHGMFRRRSEWTAFVSTLPVPFDTYHRDDQPDAVRAATSGELPAVVAITQDRVVALLGPHTLDACDGSTAALGRAIEQACSHSGLVWPVPG